jgi:hypothetical protein
MKIPSATGPRIWASRKAVPIYCLLLLWLSLGCNPATLSGFLMPFMDDKEPPECKISASSRETTIAIVTWFGNRSLTLWPEVVPCDTELSDRLAVSLRDRFQANKEKVKIVPNSLVRSNQSKSFTEAYSPAEIGKKVKADKVIALEIKSLSLREKGSSQLYRGNTEISVQVYDLEKTENQVVFEKIFQTTFPRDIPMPADGSIEQFRAQFLTRVSRELSQWFAAHSADEKMYQMNTD